MTGYALPIGTLSFSAQQNRQAFAALYGSGASGLQAMAGVRPGPGLDVTIPSGTITVTAGAAIVQSAASSIGGAYLAYLDASWTQAITAADGTFGRSDLVYLRVRDTDMDGSGFRDCSPVYVAGTPSASPVTPSIPGGTSGVVLAAITVPKSGTGSPTASYATRQYAITNGGIGVGSNTPGAYAGQYRDDGGSTGQLWRYNGTTWKSGFYLAQSGILDWGGSGGTSPINMLLAATSSDVINTRAGADTTGRFLQSADGTMAWGPGTASRDVTLNRTGTGVLSVGGSLVMTGVGQSLTAYKTADTSRTSTATATADPHLSIAIPSAGTWEISGVLSYLALGPGGGDMKFTFTFSGTVTAASSWWVSGGVLPTSISAVNAGVIPIGTTTPVGGDTTILVGAQPDGTLTCTTSGTLAVSWAQNTSTATATTLKAGSRIRATRIA